MTDPGPGPHRPERVVQRAKVLPGGRSTQVAGDQIHWHGDLVVNVGGSGGEPVPAGPPDVPRPVPEWTAERLDVHPAVSGLAAHQADRGHEFVLPRYVSRAHDRRLRTLLADCADNSTNGWVTVRGRSCTGKTRTAFEAVRTVLHDWQLLFPADTDSLLAVLSPGTLAPRTVLWLNEVQHYLTGPRGEQAAVQLRRRLDGDGPLVALATLRDDLAGDLLDPPPGGDDPHRHARLLLNQSRSVAVPDSFAENLAAARTAAAEDAAWDAAVRNGGTALIQTLAAAPDLVNRYERPTGAHGIYGRALISAAMDAHRLGVTRPLRLAFLQAAVPGYLTDDQRRSADPDNWFTDALAYACTLVKNVAAPLQTVARPDGMGPVPGMVGLADYLQQHGRTNRRLLCPPTAFWDAAAEHLTSSEDLSALADAARERFRYRHAASLYEQAADAGNPSLLARLALLREETGDQQEAERLARQIARSGYPFVLQELARRRADAGDRERAARLYQASADAGNSLALGHLAELRVSAGRQEEAERLARQAAHAGNPGALGQLAQRLADAGDRAGAERLARQAAAAGHPSALGRLALRLEDAGDQEEAARLYRDAGDAGDPAGMGRLAYLRERAGDREGAERLARQAATAGSTGFLVGLATLREDAGDQEEAMRLYREAADAGNRNAPCRIARMRERAGDREGAEQLLREAAGNPLASWTLVMIRERAGDREGAERLALQAAATGDHFALANLARRRERSGPKEEALRLYQAAADAGHTLSGKRLAELHDGKEGAPHYGLNADGTPTAPWRWPGRGRSTGI